MYLVPVRTKSRALLCLVAVLALLAVRPAQAAEKPRLQVDSYNITPSSFPPGTSWRPTFRSNSRPWRT